MQEMLSAIDRFKAELREAFARGAVRVLRDALIVGVALALMWCIFGCAAIPPVDPPEVPPVDPPPPVVVETNTPPVPPATGEVRRLALCFGWTAVDPTSLDYNGWDGACPGCDNDARAMAARLTRWGYEAKVILNEKATWDDVHIAVASAGKALRAGDWLWICASGHGGWIDDDNGDEPSGKDSTICTWDRNVRDDDVKRMLMSYIPDGVHLVLFNDQCHSEGNWRSFTRKVQKAVSFGKWGAVQPRPLIAKTDDLNFPLIQLAGCRENSYSYSAQDDDGTWNGTWTQTFLGNARDTDGLRSAFERTKEEMPYNQMPAWTEGGPVTDDFRDAPLSAASKTPAAPAARASWTPERKPKTIIFTWDPPIDNTDRTALTNLASFRVYELEAGAVTRLRDLPAAEAAPTANSPSQSTVFTNVAASSIVLGVTAVNVYGDESEMSALVTNKFSVPNPPRSAR